MNKTEQEEWERLWKGIHDFAGSFPGGIVFIGGVAVFLHVRAGKLPEGFVEFSHDGDFLISLADFADLRDLEEVTANRRLQKHQIIRNGIEFDVYLERNNDLRVKYEDAVAASSVIENVRVASLEHLLILKLDAFSSRRGSAKGDKDERDLVRICYLLSRSKIRRERLSSYLTPEATALLSAMRKSSQFMVLVAGNAHEARTLRESVGGVIDDIERILKGRR